MGHGIEFQQTLALTVGDLFEPDTLPWRLRVGTNDLPINCPLPSSENRLPWGVVNSVDHTGNVFCTVVTANGERHWEKIQLQACILARNVRRLRPKSTPTLQQVLATQSFEELRHEFPQLSAFLRSMGANLVRLSQNWKEQDDYIRLFLTQAHEADLFQRKLIA